MSLMLISQLISIVRLVNAQALPEAAHAFVSAHGDQYADQFVQ
jgi:hypothetical protein